MSSLSGKRSQESDGEEKNSTEGGLANSLSRSPKRDNKSYGEETSGLLVSESLRSTPRNHSRSLGQETPDDQGDVESQFSRRQAPYRLSYRSVSTIEETLELIQSKNSREAFCDVKKKFLEIEEKKKLAVWSKKLADIEPERAAGFSTSENPRVEAASKIKNSARIKACIAIC